jgi:hypothetical protein
LSNIETSQSKQATHSGWKTAYLAKVAILQIVERAGVDNVGMYTFTFPEDLSFLEASKRWNSFNTDVLSKRYPDGNWVKTLEITKRGRPHYHWVGVVPGIRVGCTISTKKIAPRPNSATIARLQAGATLDELAKSRCFVKESGPNLRAERRFFNQALPEFGFGTYNDISPILTTAAAAASYAAKYVTKSFGNRPESLKGARLVTFGAGAKVGTTRFSAVSGKAKIFREGLELFCLKHGLDWEDLPVYCDACFGQPGRKYVGHRWAYFLREDFVACWRDFCASQPF